MHNRSFKVTDTGIRISRRKSKWMSPLRQEHSDQLDLPLCSTDRPPLNLLLITHLHVHTNTEAPDVPPKRLIEVDAWKECDLDEN